MNTTYTINYTNTPLEGKFKISVEENVFGKIVERKSVATKEEVAEAIEAFKNKYNVARVTEFRY